MSPKRSLVVSITPAIQQIESLMFFVVMLICLVAISASTFIILILSKILDALPFGPDAEYFQSRKRDCDE